MPASFSGLAAITIRFVDELPVQGEPRYIGRNDVAFSGDALTLLRSRNLARARSQLAFESIGETFEILCEKDLPEVPLFRPLINVAMLARGVIPVHAAAFNHQGLGVLVAGWSHGSKTGTLLSFMAEGAQFVGDEWIYVSVDKNAMYGLPDKLEARPWYMRDLPIYRRKISTGDKLRIAITRGLARLILPFVADSERSNSFAAKVIRQVHQTLLDQQSIHLKPLTLFGAQACPLESALDIVVLAISHSSDAITVEPTPHEQVTKQLAASFQHEQATLLGAYQKHLFAFPGRRNALLDQAEEIYCRHALEVLSRKSVYTMLHPYPVSTHALRQAIAPLLTAKTLERPCW